MSASEFVTELQSLKCANTFNPYRDVCTEFDFEDANAIRTNTLLRILEVAVNSEIDSLWIGRDLGHRGGRRTGLAFTDDRHLANHGERWNVPTPSPTVGSEVSERTATVIWQILNRTESNIFLWNVFPLHPHLDGLPFTNRAHTAAERRIGMEVLDELIELIRPRRLICIGADARMAVSSFGSSTKIYSARHPSYGGQAEFIDQMTRLFELN